ncbi:hypothetical protein ACHAWF_004322 [Thalassiosira exigua]
MELIDELELALLSRHCNDNLASGASCIGVLAASGASCTSHVAFRWSNRVGYLQVRRRGAAGPAPAADEGALRRCRPRG